MCRRAARSYGEHTVMPVNDSAADPESDAVAFVAFGGEERLKHSGQRVRGHSATGVGNCEDNSFSPGLPLCSFAAADKKTAASGSYCIDGIADKVANNLQDLALEAGDGMVSAIAPL